MIDTIIDAFIALNQLDDEDVKGMIKSHSNNKNLIEGKSYGVFSSKSELEDAKEYLNAEQPKEVELEVIDANADTKNHLQNPESYIGQAIMICKKCLAPTFLPMDQVEVSENDPETFNVEMECPNCHCKGDGFEFEYQVAKRETESDNEQSEDTELESTDDTLDITDHEQEDNSEETLDKRIDSEDVTIDNDEKSSGDEATFDNDLEEEPKSNNADTESNSEESAESNVEIDDVQETDELTLDDSEEEKDDMETDSSEDELDDIQMPKLGDEYEEDFAEDDEDKEPIKEELNELAKEAWLMNKVIMAMNNEEAYYGGWLYTWPDGESEEDCQRDFGEQESFDDLKKEFIDTYKEYHADGLFEPDKETIEYARKQDHLLGLRPIDVYMRKKHDKEEIAETLDVECVADLFRSIIEPENIEQVIVYNVCDNKQEPKLIYQGSYDELPANINPSILESFNVADGHLICNIDDEQCERCNAVDKMLRKFDDMDTEKVSICNAASGDELFSGNVDDAIKQHGNDSFVSFETPMVLKIYINNPELLDMQSDESEEQIQPLDKLIKDILKANNLSEYKINKPQANEYWINECIRTNDDLDIIYEKFVKGTNTVDEFKQVTGFKDELDKAMEKYGIDKVVSIKPEAKKTTKKAVEESVDEEDIDLEIDDESEDQQKVESFKDRKSLSKAIEECKNNNRPYSVKRSLKEGFRYDLIHEDVDEEETYDIEIIDDEPDIEIVDDEPQITANSSTHLVDPNMSRIEREALNKIHDVALTICNAIRDTYGIEADPALVVADIIQDLRLISGTIDVEDLEPTVMNQITKNMFDSYNQFYTVVDEIMSELTGENIHTTPAQKLRHALNMLHNPAFETENIYLGIQSPKFLQAVQAGAIPYINRLELTNNNSKQLDTSATEATNLDIEFDTEQFDDDINEYFNDNYEDTLLYTTDNGTVDSDGCVVLEGLIQGEDVNTKVTFTLTPKEKLSESLKVVENRSDILKDATYTVTNNLSEEVFEFKRSK